MGHFIYPTLDNQIQVHWMPVIRDFRQSCSSSKYESFNMVSRNLGLKIMNCSMPIPPRRMFIAAFTSYFLMKLRWPKKSLLVLVILIMNLPTK